VGSSFINLGDSYFINLGDTYFPASTWEQLAPSAGDISEKYYGTYSGQGHVTTSPTPVYYIYQHMRCMACCKSKKFDYGLFGALMQLFALEVLLEGTVCRSHWSQLDGLACSKPS
jgi:hypothetical protein